VLGDTLLHRIQRRRKSKRCWRTNWAITSTKDIPVGLAIDTALTLIGLVMWLPLIMNGALPHSAHQPRRSGESAAVHFWSWGPCMDLSTMPLGMPIRAGVNGNARSYDSACHNSAGLHLGHDRLAMSEFGRSRSRTRGRILAALASALGNVSKMGNLPKTVRASLALTRWFNVLMLSSCDNFFLPRLPKLLERIQLCSRCHRWQISQISKRLNAHRVNEPASRSDRAWRVEV